MEDEHSLARLLARELEIPLPLGKEGLKQRLPGPKFDFARDFVFSFIFIFVFIVVLVCLLIYTKTLKAVIQSILILAVVFIDRVVVR